MTYKYRAFISYSHADEVWARWLQRKLERYRGPRRLATAAGQPAKLPRRLHPVFRDRDELATSTDLGKAVQQALNESAFLIVVCSPQSALSRWVNEEIAHFKQSGRSDKILCLVVDGDLSPQSDRCAFPPALLVNTNGTRAPEPLAADVRKQADGPRAALIKITAGLLEVGVDDLRQREVQRQVRRWIAVSVTSGLIAVVTIALAVAALRAREEAQVRRGQAENLISFMLGDLRGRLEPIGKLDVLDAVGDEAMAYYAQLGDQATPTEMLNRAVALRQIGEVRFAQGQFDPALTAFEQSRTQAERLYQGEPGNNDHLFELGQAEFWVGYVQYESGLLDRSAESMSRYLEHSNELIRREPGNPDYVMELAYAYSNIGTIERERGNAQSALAHFSDAVAINESLLVQHPDDAGLKFDLGEGYSWLGSIRQDLGQLESSETAFRRSLEIWDSLAEQGMDARHTEKAADGAQLLALIWLQQGKLYEAIGLSETSAASFSRLLQNDAENVRYRRGLYKTWYYLADMHRLDAQTRELPIGVADPDEEEPEAQQLRYLDLAEQGFTDLVKLEADDKSMAEFLHLTWRLRALDHLSRGNPDLALGYSAMAWEESIRELEPDRLVPRERRNIALIGDAHSRVLKALHNFAAEEEVRSAILSQWLDRTGTDLMQKALKARLLAEQGLTEEARVLTDELKASGFRHPGFSELFD